ncbi:YcxB family protein [Acidicapsa dinghuensis]|uniref:YcxB family protein n=1 Tax=Acidicapsa dinghuensis TaxID=2218256 RepID=A0ABW1EDL3_9BACT
MRRVFDKRIPAGNRANWTDINDQGVTSAIVGTEEGVFSWEDVAGFAQNEKITLLYLDKRRFLFFPTSVLNQSQRAELKDLVARNLVRDKC